MTRAFPRRGRWQAAAAGMVVCILLCGAPPHARAQSDEPFLVRLSPDAGVDREAFRLKLETDLRAQVRLLAPDDPGPARLAIEVDGHAGNGARAGDAVAVFSLRRPDLPDLVRRARLPDEASERLATLALLSANLLRDEAADVLRWLQPAEPAPPREEPAPSAFDDSASGGVTADQATADRATEAPRAADNPPPPPHTVPIGIDFAPGVGASSGFLGQDLRYVGLGLLGALSGGVAGVTVSGLVDLSLGSVEGVQLGSVFVWAEKVEGVQFSGLVAAEHGRLAGVQAGGLLAIAGGRVTGVQLASIATLGGSPTGIQAAGVLAVSDGAVRGLQLAGLGTVAVGPLRGLSLSGGANVAAGEVEGAQVGGVNVSSAAVEGAQIGLINVAAGGVEGAQVGLVNVAAGRVRGLQLGLVNVSPRATASVGLVPVHPESPLQFRAGLDSAGTLRLFGLFGGDVFHMVGSAGFTPFPTRATFSFGLGPGVRIYPINALQVDLQALAHTLLDDASQSDSLASAYEARLVVAGRLNRVLSLYGAASYQVHIAPLGGGGVGAPLAHRIGRFSRGLEPDGEVRGWPALEVGLQLL